jgi:hypothetical protein
MYLIIFLNLLINKIYINEKHKLQSIKTNNLLTVINAYQTYKLRKG